VAAVVQATAATPSFRLRSKFDLHGGAGWSRV